MKKVTDITNLDTLKLIEAGTELFRLNHYKSKAFVQAYIGLGIHRSGFYGRLASLGGEPIALKENQTIFDSTEDVILLIEGIVALKSLPVNNGIGNIVYSGYGLLEVEDSVIFDGRSGMLVLTNGNGTTANGNTIDLGGTLTQNTTINADNNSFTVSNSSFISLTTPTNYGLSVGSGQSSISGSGFTYSATVAASSAIFGSSSAFIQTSSGGLQLYSNGATLLMPSVAGPAIFTGISNNPINYANDSSANYTSRSLIDKAYADGISFYNNDGSISSDRTVTLGANNLDINLDSTGVFAIQDGGTDVFTVDASGEIGLKGVIKGSGNTSATYGINIKNTDSDETFKVLDNGVVQGLFFQVGSFNIYFGDGAGGSLSGGTSNTLIGTSAGGSVVSGSNNTVIGFGAYQAATSGSNVVIGVNAIDTETPGEDNVYVGTAAQTGNTVTRSLGLGHGVNVGHSYSIGLGYQATTTANNQLVIGSSGSRVNHVFLGRGVENTGASDVIIQNTNLTGTNAASYDLTIQSGKSTGSADGGSIIFKASQGGVSGTTQNAQSTFLTINPSTGVDIENSELYFGGSLFVKKFTGGSQLTFGNSAASNTNTTSSNKLLAVGENSLTSHDGVSNLICVGHSSLTSFDGNASGSPRDILVMGHASGNSIIDGADREIIIGHNSGGSITSGDDNIIIGHRSGTSITSAKNTIIGNSSAAGNNMGEVVIVGNSTTVGAVISTSVGIGEDGSISATSTTAIGGRFNASHNFCVLLGRSVESTAVNQFVVGSSNAPITTAYIGYGENYSFGGPLSLQNNNITAGTTDTASGTFTIQSGKSTGSADGGAIIFKASQAGVSGTAQNAQSTFLTIDPSTGVDVENSELYFGGASFLYNTGSRIFLGKSQTRPPAGQGVYIGDSLSYSSSTGGAVVGYNNSITGSHGVALGCNIVINGATSVSIGNSSTALAQAVALGYSADAFNNSVAIGFEANDSFGKNVVIGKSATSTAQNQFVSGSSNTEIKNVYFGYGVQHTAASNISLQNNNITSGTTDTASGSFTIQSGQSTGSADGGNLIFKVSDAGASGTAQNAQSTVFELGASKIGMYGVTPTTRATTGIGAATFAANTSGISDDTATFGGYTIGQVVQALQTIGVLT